MSRGLIKITSSFLLVAVIVMLFASYLTPYTYATSLQYSRANQNIAYNSLAIIDYSNASQGTVSVSYIGGTDRQIVVEIRKNDRLTGLGDSYFYRINNYGKPEQLVLSEGNGRYVINVFRAIGVTQHNRILSTTIEVTLTCEFMPFLQPNKFVNFTTDGAVAELAERLRRDCPIATTRFVFRYVHNNMTYDFELARSESLGWYEPNLEELLLVTRRGICFDFASLMTALLRLNDIPAKMVFGYFEGKYWHAWVNAYFPEYGWVILDPTMNMGDDRVLQATRIVGRQHFDETYFDAGKFF